jgi:hypothetical protein
MWALGIKPGMKPHDVRDDLNECQKVIPGSVFPHKKNNSNNNNPGQNNGGRRGNNQNAGPRRQGDRDAPADQGAGPNRGPR